MEMTLIELVVLAGALALLYRLLRPLQERLERLILDLIDPKRRGVIDVEHKE